MESFLFMFRRKVRIQQRDITDCGPACIVSIAAFYGIHLTIQLVRYHSSTDRRGTTVAGMMEALHNYGFQSRAIKTNVHYLKELVFPAIALIKKETLQHYVVIYKVSDKYVRYMDPGSGTMIKCSVEDYSDLFTGVLITIQPPNKIFQSEFKSRSFFDSVRLLLRPYKRHLFQAIIGAVVYTLLGLSTSIYIKFLVDHVWSGKQIPLLNLLSIIMLMVLGMMILINWNRQWISIKLGQIIDAQILIGYFNYVLNLPSRIFDKMFTGEIISRVSDSIKIRVFITDALIGFLVNIFIVIFSFLLMFFLSWELTVIVSFIIPIYSVLYFTVNKLRKRSERKVMETWANTESYMISSIESIETVKLFGLENEVSRQNETKMIRFLESIYYSGLNSIVSLNLTEFITRATTITLLWVGSYHVIQQKISSGDLMSFYAVLGYFNGPLQNLMNFNKIYQNARIAVDRLFEIEQMEGSKDFLRAESLISPAQNIEFKSVCFRYGPGKEIFKDFSLAIQAGQFTTIVGRSGSGKSTLLSLLYKKYSPDSGKICFGNQDIAPVNRKSLNNLIGVAPQSPGILEGTLIENITVGDPNPDPAKIYEICRTLQIPDFVEEMPQGLLTQLGKGGVELSGGQKQLMGLIRLRYVNPEIILMDEPVSMLDPVSSKVLDILIQFFQQQKKTIVLVTHRLEYTFGSDQIILLENGKIVESGEPVELLQRGKMYSFLVKSQFAEPLEKLSYVG